ncbi:unnamed protein product [Calicophoron daubneyi]|uniref:mRNA-decapping enzyme 2 n=1 Tax=Calicophoron daubneyi TaxID=300641 RepID=A0AAV2TD10_CALDB
MADSTPVLPNNTLVQLYTRFILNLPDDVKKQCAEDFVRLFFEIERAHWFYLDYFIEDPTVGGVDMFGFTQQLVKKFPQIVPQGVDWQKKYVEWRKYRGKTETGSAIIIDEYYRMVLLVQGFYGNRWSFPGGKVNENETLVECAAREVMEETSLDVEYRIVPSLYIDRRIGGALRRAFIIENMPRTARLQPATKNEIEAITWFNLEDLPTNTQDNSPVEKLNMRPNNFYLVMPFIKQLQLYVKLRLTGLPAPSALKESQHAAESQPSEIPPVPEKPDAGQPAALSPKTKASRSRARHRKTGQTRAKSATDSKTNSGPSLKSPQSKKHKVLVPSLDTQTFDPKDLVFLNTSPTDTHKKSSPHGQLSAPCWENVHVRGDALVNLLSWM